MKDRHDDQNERQDGAEHDNLPRNQARRRRTDGEANTKRSGSGETAPAELENAKYSLTVRISMRRQEDDTTINRRGATAIKQVFTTVNLTGFYPHEVWMSSNGLLAS